MGLTSTYQSQVRNHRTNGSHGTMASAYVWEFSATSLPYLAKKHRKTAVIQTTTCWTRYDRTYDPSALVVRSHAPFNTADIALSTQGQWIMGDTGRITSQHCSPRCGCEDGKICPRWCAQASLGRQEGLGLTWRGCWQVHAQVLRMVWWDIVNRILPYIVARHDWIRASNSSAAWKVR